MKLNLIALAFVSHFLFPQNLFANTPLQLHLNWKAEPEFGGFYQAQFDGEFKKLGLSVEVLEGGAGTPTVQMLASGKFPYAIVSGDEIVISRDRGSDVVALLTVFQTAPYAIMSHANRNFKSIQDVFANEGTLLVVNGLPYVEFLKNKFKNNSKVKLAPYQGGVTAFLNDPKLSQQCFQTAEPFVAEQKGAKVNSFLVANEGFNPYTVVLATTEKNLKKNPDEVQKIVQAVRAGWASYIKNPTAANLKMNQINPSMSLETFTKGAQAQIPLIQPAKAEFGTMSDERWKTLTQQLKEMKLIQKNHEPQSFYRIVK